MKEQFIPYELALELMKLGFNETCMTYYNHDSRLDYSDDWAIGVDYESKRDRNQCLAPLWQQAFDWFREEYKLLHIIDGIHSTDPFELNCQILNIENGDSYYLGSYTGNIYKEAQQVCLEKLIKIVKK